MKLLGALMLMLGLGSLVVGEVLKSGQTFLATCPQFFVQIPPMLPGQGPAPTTAQGQWLQYVEICQRRNGNTYYFATLYDTVRRIPVYSAYEYRTRTSTQGLKSGSWYIEPQLDDPSSQQVEQMSDTNIHYKPSNSKADRGLRQALNCDYEHTDFDKGHLIAARYAFDQATKDATFTLTNAAPQYENLNRTPWKNMERTIKIALDACLSINQNRRAYIITGVEPGNTWMASKNTQNRVKIPSYFWTAYCCLDIVGNVYTVYDSGAYRAQNVNNVPPQPVPMVTIVQLNQYLNTAFYGNQPNPTNQPFSVFGGSPC